MARSFDDATPIYLQIAEEIRTQVLDGSLPEGARLTSTTEYATRYRINPATASKAVALLVDEGLVVKRRGIGMFVAEGAQSALRSRRRGSYATEVLAPALEQGRLLGLDDGDILTAVRALLASRPAPDDEPHARLSTTRPVHPSWKVTS
ncbi:MULTISPECIES: GntR family transcriptional regulator [unclassified Actinomyces]|uniref:GntR family transcriptional regulator n=2 Tax=Actinomyces TaxID=1654 RepID=UPI0020178CF9|nr:MULTISPECIES: GntR family transcriptional regulator [unclassified Actinomyces]MCL3778626.1 GntR family transcriptional regulator [Actinomyces sp. AC-20-1]MCL3790895.1 GntR family transcriptional regulator [Actinomyces sp. 187325]MCL3793150.1 GntR family transcriptional regulator [Actinomyces sp. 186855]MCL3795501.1 GntR family transcriptional regulator [Actinomyces sp. 217892]